MKLILYPLLILMLLAGFNQLLLNSSTDLTYNGSLTTLANGTQILNSTSSTLSQGSSDAIFDINMISGIVALIIGLVAVGVVAGIHVFGSGLSDYSVQLIHKSTFYYGLWGIFSALSFTCFNSIPVIGLFLWLGMTLIYTIGFAQSLNTSSGGS